MDGAVSKVIRHADNADFTEERRLSNTEGTKDTEKAMLSFLCVLRELRGQIKKEDTEMRLAARGKERMSRRKSDGRCA
jgi:hypothetical protein